ncbi:hypothetical protein RVR_8373 [Actinacidiphila reveromycinica]|uniref:Uncharacterized protein n=1 Tax=Actinacidiphila reveromycinica TaxID=659352 RepID=A0A7U3UVP1_9ACTN|nr:hypothetical protein [Streptomyces sp. SN-593]BBB01116.1 hypothetical protein RVR_8373 [Streptomyces sp. SN-593]
MTPDLIRDAAVPIAEALNAVQDLAVRVPPVDVLVSYTNGGVVVRVADRSSARREEIEAAFRAAFAAAGWGMAVRRGGGLRLDHPVGLARLSHS